MQVCVDVWEIDWECAFFWMVVWWGEDICTVFVHVLWFSFRVHKVYERVGLGVALFYHFLVYQSRVPIPLFVS